MAKEKQAKVEQDQEVNDAQMTAEAEAKAIIENNLRFYSQGCEVPADALKPIRAGRLKGMSDVNPMWRMKRMTEIFGPVGFGWKYEIVKQWSEEFIHEETVVVSEGLPPIHPKFDQTGKVISPAVPAVPKTEQKTRKYEIKCFCNVLLFVRDPETKEWSSPIPGNGGSAIVSMESKGAYVNDEGYKMALTDALSIAMKPLGIGGNIWYGPNASGHNESKYEASTREDANQQPQQRQSTSAMGFVDAQLKEALEELGRCTTVEHIHALWQKWRKAVPALCAKGTEFYQAVSAKSHSIQNPAK